MHAERLDGFVGLAGCDKSIPAMLMAAARLDLPSVFVYNGSIMPGEHNGVALDITSVFEAVGACARGQDHRGGARRDRAQGLPGRGRLRRHVHRQHDELDRRGDRHVLPGTASPPAVDAPPRGRRPPRRRGRRATCCGSASRRGMIMTKEAFENAIAVTSALGGSTNAVLHLLAIANEAGVELHLDDFNRIAAKVPHIADMKPGGKFHMSDLDRVGGVPVVMKHLLDAGLLHGDVHHRHRQDDGREPRRRSTRRGPTAWSSTRSTAPIHTEGGINVLTGSLAPKGSVVKVAGLTKEQMRVRGPGARVRRRGRGDGRDPRRLDRARHRARDPLRGPEGRAGHARDAGHHRRAEGRRPGRRLRADHRRPLLRRHVGLLHRPRRPGGGRRRPDRVRARRRPRSASTSTS